MEMLVFGHQGTPVLVFPSSMGRFHEWEDFGMINAAYHQLDQGYNQFFCVDSVDGESLYNRNVDPYTRFVRYQQYQSYIIEEVIPFIRTHNANPYTVVAGASFGAFHACNIALKYPKSFGKLIAMSGKYDIRGFADGFYDDNIYFNNPVDYLPNMNNHDHLEDIRRLDLRFTAGDHDICLDATKHFCHLLYEKGIWYECDVWSPNVIHDWPAWKSMLLKHLA